MKNVIIGTRGSQLALAQANIVKKLLEDLAYSVELKTISTIGDRDTTSQLHRFRGQGVFTSALEIELEAGTIDLAVHSLKDLPIEDNHGLQIIAYLKRNDPSDSLLIKNTHIINKSPLKLVDHAKIATGSPRRQSQILAINPTVNLMDIRGNVNTRISQLQMRHIDGIVMATAVFERISLEIPPDVVRVLLPIDIFPTTPGQGAIAIQGRLNEFSELEAINDKNTEIMVKQERELLKKFGGGCELSLGLIISGENNIWKLNSTFAAPTWNLSKDVSLTRYQFTADSLAKLADYFISSISPFITKVITSSSLENKKIIIARNLEDSLKYEYLLQMTGAITNSMGIFDYRTDYSKIDDKKIIETWNNAKWVVLTSQRAVEFLHLLQSIHPRTGYKIAVVGSATAKKVRENNLPVHLIADGNLTSLQELLKDAINQYPGAVLFLSGKHVTGLPSLEAVRIQVYEATLKALILPFKPDIIVVFSKRSAKHIIDTFGRDFAELWVSIGQKTFKYLNTLNIPLITAESPTPEAVKTVILDNLNKSR